MRIIDNEPGSHCMTYILCKVCTSVKIIDLISLISWICVKINYQSIVLFLTYGPIWIVNHMQILLTFAFSYDDHNRANR